MGRAVLIVAGLMLAGCSSGPLDSTDSVCTEFARFIRDGRPADQRSEVVSSMGEVVGNADQGVQDAYETLTATVNGPAGQDIADDTFAQACFDAGWDG